MNKLVLATLASASLLTASAAAHADATPASIAASTDDEPAARNGIHVDVFSPLLGEFGIAYERVFTSRVSVELQASALHWNLTDDQGRGGAFDAWFVGAQPHIYFAQKAPAGIYVAPFVRAGRASVKLTESTTDANVFELGATLGYSLVVGPVNLKAGLGLQYANLDVSFTDRDGVSKGSGAGFLPTGDLSLGVVF